MSSKPSTAANLILLILVLAVIGGIGWGGWWGYNKFIANRGTDQPPAVADADPDSAADPAPTPDSEPEPTPDPAEDDSPDIVVADTSPTPDSEPEPASDPAEDDSPDIVVADTSPAPDPDFGLRDDPSPDPLPGVEPMPDVDPGLDPDSVPTPDATIQPMPDVEPVPDTGVVDATDEPLGPPAPRPEAVAEEFQQFEVKSGEGKALIEDAKRRIDEAPDDLYTEREKHLVRVGIESATQVVRLCTVFFDVADGGLAETELARLKAAVESDQATELASDPRAVFMVLGFADPSGNADFNKTLSMQRAEQVAELLRDDYGVENMTYPVAIGPTEIISEANREKNRAAEVWLVLP